MKETITLLKGDLDWIVMKCLEKDRQRRYETANGLAADLKRHLNNEPVTARPPSTAYRFQKAFRRNKLVFAAGTAVALALSLGIIASTWQSVRATRAKREAVSARQLAETSEAKAVAAQASEVKLREQADVARRQAEADELVARQRAYASDMNVAMQALQGSNLGRAQDLLNRQRPQPGQKDLRGWEWRYLWQQTHSDALFTLCQKTEIGSLAASANGEWLAIGLAQKDGLFVYDLQTRQEVAQLASGENEVRAAFSPTESLLAFTSGGFPGSSKEQHKLRLWSAVTRETVAEIPLDATCAGLAFAEDGKTLVTSTGLGHITTWRIPEGNRLTSYPSEQQPIPVASTGFAATSDLGLAAYVTKSGQVRVIDLHDDGRELWRAVASRYWITALAFSPDGKTLASAAGFSESDIRLWDVATGMEIGRLEGHQSWVGSLVFWPDGKKLASASADQTIRTWDVASRACLDVLRGHRLEVWRLALLPDHKTLVSGAKDGTVCLWDTSVAHPHQPRISVPAKVANWRFTPDSRSLVSLDIAGGVSRCRGPDFQERESIRLETADLPDRSTYAGSLFSPDGRFLAVGYTNGKMFIWDLSRRLPRRDFKPGDGSVTPLSFLARGNRLVVRIAAENRLSEWDLEANREIQSWLAPTKATITEGFEVSPDERMGIGVGWNGDISGRNLPEHTTTNPPLDVLQGWEAAFSSDGKRFAVASALGYARVWETATWKEEATLRGFLNAVHAVAFSPDGQRLATGGSNPDDTVKLWDTASWQELLTLEGEGSLFDLTSFSPDGNAIGAWSGSDGTLNLWRAPSWAEINATEAMEKAESQQP